MRLPLMLAAALAASLFAGCLGAGGQTMTAREGLGDARSAAEAWADGGDLELLGVVAIEPFKHIRYESDDGDYKAEYVTHLDSNPGDGKAPGWAYGFYTGERCVSIVLAAGLGVLAEGYETCDGDVETLPEWSYDSDQVAEILADHDEWPDLGEDGTYFWGLFNDEGKALWAVGGEGEDGETVFASVDASSGEVLEIAHETAANIEEIFQAESQAEKPVDMGGSDQDSDSAPYLAVTDELVVEVDLGAMGRIDAEVGATTIVNYLTLTVEGPYGQVAEERIGGLVNGVSLGTQSRSYADLPAGHYTLTLSSGGASTLVSLSAYSEW
ncbi:MAG: hypothetical protein QOC71_944 [Thermoplasmata archaeon]|jgi:hypothetical protein|nr:hypothetical protein [Thermoplasmata archaeon]